MALSERSASAWAGRSPSCLRLAATTLPRPSPTTVSRPTRAPTLRRSRSRPRCAAQSSATGAIRTPVRVWTMLRSCARRSQRPAWSTSSTSTRESATASSRRRSRTPRRPDTKRRVPRAAHARVLSTVLLTREGAELGGGPHGDERSGLFVVEALPARVGRRGVEQVDVVAEDDQADEPSEGAADLGVEDGIHDRRAEEPRPAHRRLVPGERGAIDGVHRREAQHPLPGRCAPGRPRVPEVEEAECRENEGPREAAHDGDIAHDAAEHEPAEEENDRVDDEGDDTRANGGGRER